MKCCRSWQRGTWISRPTARGSTGLLVGKQLADEWKLQPGDYVTLTSPQGRLTPFGLMPRTRRFRVAGVFDSGFYDYDENWCFVTLPAAQSLAGAGNIVNVLEFRLAHPEQAEAIGQEAEHAAGQGFLATTWMEENRALFRALRLEKLVTAIFMGLITFVAGLNILVVLSMTVTDRAKDIAVLLSMGARREQIRRIFLYQGIAIGATGIVIGLADRIRLQLDCGKVSLDPFGSPGLCGAVRAVPRQFSGWNVDRPGGHGHCGCRDVAAGERGVAAAAGGDS